MKFFWFALFLFMVSVCQAQFRREAAAEFEKEVRDRQVQVLDVRTAGEFNTGHISNAMQANWNNQEEFSNRVQYLDRERPVYVYCMVGARSDAAAHWMVSHGFKKVIELKGGLLAWKKENFPLDAFKTEKQISLAEFNASINNGAVVLVDFGASWCPPCIKMQPVLDSLQKDPQLKFELVKVDASTQMELMKSLQIESIPAFIVYKNGKETWRKEGFVPLAPLQSQLK